MKIIQAQTKHYQDIIDIYNWAIEYTTSTFDTELKTLENYQPFLDSLNNYPLFILIENKKTIGWGCLKPYSQRLAYKDTVELSVYIHPNFHGKGGGSIMIKALIDEAIKRNYHTILSRVTAESEASINLHKKYDFKRVGTMKEVGFKFGRRIDVIILQKLVKSD